jgi:serine/threonine protein kinase
MALSPNTPALRSWPRSGRERVTARDSRLGRDVALKILPEERSSDPARLRRFETEARTVASLNHPHILALHDVGSH